MSAQTKTAEQFYNKMANQGWSFWRNVEVNSVPFEDSFPNSDIIVLAQAYNRFGNLISGLNSVFVRPKGYKSDQDKLQQSHKFPIKLRVCLPFTDHACIGYVVIGEDKDYDAHKSSEIGKTISSKINYNHLEVTVDIPDASKIKGLEILNEIDKLDTAKVLACEADKVANRPYYFSKDGLQMMAKLIDNAKLHNVFNVRKGISTEADALFQQLDLFINADLEEMSKQ